MRARGERGEGRGAHSIPVRCPFFPSGRGQGYVINLMTSSCLGSLHHTLSRLG